MNDPGRMSHVDPITGFGTIAFSIGERIVERLRSLVRSAVTMLPRQDYKAVWNSVSRSEDDAKIAVSGVDDEDAFRQSVHFTVAMLQTYVGIRPDDTVLEIGAGVGRVGDALAPLCREWIGTDVSDNMIGHLRRRLARHRNIRGVVTNGFDLRGIEDASVDVVYATVVFMHLDEWERFGYVREGLRVLKPGGRMIVDNVNLTSDAGWKVFLEHSAIPARKRPPHIAKTSTPQELETYFRRAGFSSIRQVSRDLWIFTYGIKNP
jgi:ubiquinone/menaquinone biosynthesis C-methylase UbiE